MALNRVHIFKDDEILTADNLNAEFNNLVLKFDGNIVAEDINVSTLPASERYIDASFYSTLSEAVEAAISTKLHLWIPAGTYTNDFSPIVLPEGFVVEGSGKDKVTIKPHTDFNSDSLFIISGNNVSIRGITFEDPSSWNSLLTKYAHVRISMTNGIGVNSGINLNDINFNITTSTPVGLLRSHLAMSGTSGGITIDNCDFNGDDTPGRTMDNVHIESFTNVRFKNCSFTNGRSSIRSLLTGGYVGFISVQDCVFNGGGSMTEFFLLTCGGLIEACQFYISNSNTIQLRCIYVNSLPNCVLTIDNCIINNTNTLHPPYIVEGLKGSVLLRNIALIGAGTYTYTVAAPSAVLGDFTATAYNNEFERVDTFDPLVRVQADPIFTKLWNSSRLLVLDDVYVWISYVSTINYLRFKQGSPPTADDDYDAQIAMTSNLADLTA